MLIEYGWYIIIQTLKTQLINGFEDSWKKTNNVMYKELNSISTGCPVKIYQYEMVTGGVMESILPLHFKLVNSRGTSPILCILHTAAY